MDDLNGGAAAPAETTTAPSTEAEVTPPNPISTDPRPAETKADTENGAEEKKAPSTREALKRAAERVKADDDQGKKSSPIQSAAKADPSTAKSPEPVKPVAGQEQAKPQVQQTAHRDAPARFSNDAKAAWETSPEPVRAEIHRAIRELEEGHAKYKSDAEAFAEIREFDELARSSGTTMKAAMTNYVGIERLLAQNPIAGFQRIAQNMNLDLRQVAAAVLGQNPQQVATQQDQTIRELRQHIEQLEHTINHTVAHVRGQQEASVQQQVDTFKLTHPRTDELEDDIALFIQTGRAQTLEEAYDLADRLNPAPSINPPAAQTAPDLSAQTRKGSKSVSGAPANGSDPTAKRPSTSIRDSIRRAVSQAG